MTEIYVCKKCAHRGALDQHGRCEHCGSDEVVSTELLSLKEKKELVA